MPQDKHIPAAAGPEGPLPIFHWGHPHTRIPTTLSSDVPIKKIPRGRIFIAFVVLIGLALLANFLEHLGHHAGVPNISLPWVLPFVLLLACIATMPFIAKHFWEKYYSHVAIALAFIVACYYVFFVSIADGKDTVSGALNMAKSFAEYLSFIMLLGSLFTVSGGILIRVRKHSTPFANTLLLAIGAILANLVGTTGAAMLLIRPYLGMNRNRIRPFHVVFFIFIVANTGGALTPIGDPPLFLGYLKGVPFWWVLEHCWPLWATAVGILLTVFFIMDTAAMKKYPPADHAAGDTAEEVGPILSIYGLANVGFLLLILIGVFMPPPAREILMATAIFGSLLVTPHRIHLENRFNFGPIKEVALLFIGIFATMVPALNYLSIHASDKEFDQLLHTPGQYYYVTGALSSVLDNAPTYVTFLETELAKLDPDTVHRAKVIVRNPDKSEPAAEDLAGLSEENQHDLVNSLAALKKFHGDKVQDGSLTDDQIRVGFLLFGHLQEYLIAISLGAVFFGACTYIGNGPNFMVKAIADHAGVKTPSFFGYIGVYVLPIFLPTLILVWAIFLR